MDVGPGAGGGRGVHGYGLPHLPPRHTQGDGRAVQLDPARRRGAGCVGRHLRVRRPSGVPGVFVAHVAVGHPGVGHHAARGRVGPAAAASAGGGAPRPHGRAGTRGHRSGPCCQSGCDRGPPSSSVPTASAWPLEGHARRVTSRVRSLGTDAVEDCAVCRGHVHPGGRTEACWMGGLDRHRPLLHRAGRRQWRLDAHRHLCRRVHFRVW